MRYVTSIERLAKEEGQEEGSLKTARESVISVLQFRFSEVLESITEAINQINDLSVLQNLLIQGVAISSLSDFEQVINQ